MKLKHIAIIGIIALLLLASGCIQQKVVDSDGDGWSDEQELNAGTDPDNRDTDSDGYWDPLDENPLDPEIPVPSVTPTPRETVRPTPQATPTPIPTPAFEITYPNDGDSVPRQINVVGQGGKPDAEVRIHVCTEDEGDRLRPNVGYVEEDGNWEVDSVRIWQPKGYPLGEEAVIYAVMTVSQLGRTTILYSENATVFFE
ncbi:MAG: hypothetical protein KAT13_06650 [Methanosarcinales archaeon]|jgi:hypothetical protein|nr:hypothetical protein [Methanosarcinales archaeon]